MFLKRSCPGDEVITVAHAFVATIGAIAQCGAVPVLVDYFDVYQNYVIRSTQRDRLAAHLRASGIEVLVSWPTPLHKQKALDLGHFNLPVTEKISKEVLSIPMYPELNDDEVEMVIDAIQTFKG